MAVQCPPYSASALESTNGNYEPVHSRLGSRAAFRSCYSLESSRDLQQIPQADLKRSPFFTGMEKVMQALEGVEADCTKMIEKFRKPDEPGSSQSGVSQGSIENNPMMMKSPSLDMGAYLSEKKRDKFTPPMKGQDVIIDLTSEDSFDSRSSGGLDHEPVDAGQVQSSPLGTSLATGVMILSDDDEDDDAGDGVEDFVEQIEAGNTPPPPPLTPPQSFHSENNAKPAVKAGGSGDPLANTWANMDAALLRYEREGGGAKQEPPQPLEPIVSQGVSLGEGLELGSGFKDSAVKRRKFNLGDDVSNTIRDPGSTYFQWPGEGMQLDPQPVPPKPKRPRGRPRKYPLPPPPPPLPPATGDSVDCRDILEVFVEGRHPRADSEVYNVEDRMAVDVQPKNGGKMAAREREERRNAEQLDQKVKKKRQNPEELLEDEADDEAEECVKSGLDLGGELLKHASKLMNDTVDYEPYVPSKFQKEEDALEEEVDDIISQWKTHMTSQGPSDEKEAMVTDESSEKCEHQDFDWDPDMGYYCDDCGATNIPMPKVTDTPKVPEKPPCRHVHHEYKDDAGLFCLDCGRVWRDIQNLFICMEQEKGPRKQMQRGQERTEGTSHVRLNVGGSNGSATNFRGVDLPLHPLFEEKLLPHQKKGFKFLNENLLDGAQGQGGKEPMGCVLAHAPGTGKSCLVISFIQSFLTKFPEGKPLILAPKVMLPYWEAQFETWKVQEVAIYRIGGLGGSCNNGEDGEEEEEAHLVSPGMSVKESRAITLRDWHVGRGGVLLMSYNMFQILVSGGLKEHVLQESLDYKMSKLLLEATNLVILDEGHLARNYKTQISQALHRMQTKRKVILSGTLFQNNFRELYNLMKICRDDFMISHPLYQRRIAELAASSNGSKHHGNSSGALHKRSMKEIMLIEEKIFTDEIGDKLAEYVRSGAVRTDTIEPVILKLQSLTPFIDWYPGDILKSLPGLFEYSVHLKLTSSQNDLITKIIHPNYMARQSSLSAACIHPALAEKAFPNEDESSLKQFVSRSSSLEKDPFRGGKITFVFQLMAKCKAAKEKVLIFCTTLNPLYYIEELFAKEFKWHSGKEIVRLEGSMQEAERQKVIEQFNKPDSHAQVLLASTKACKEGISLVGASRVVILDTTDNPSVVRQAVSRAFRIGQTKKVFVYRLVAEQKDENQIFMRSVNKERLSQVLLDPVATMARMRGFLQPCEGLADVEDTILREMMQTDRSKHSPDDWFIREVQKYNAMG